MMSKERQDESSYARSPDASAPNRIPKEKDGMGGGREGGREGRGRGEEGGEGGVGQALLLEEAGQEEGVRVLPRRGGGAGRGPPYIGRQGALPLRSRPIGP